MRPSGKKRRSFQRGYSLILMAVCAVVLIGLMGLVIDTGWVYLNEARLQDAADAAAMAGVNNVQTGNSAAESHSSAAAAKNQANGKSVLLAQNPNNDPDGDIVVGYWDSSAHKFYNDGDPNRPAGAVDNAVKIVARLTNAPTDGTITNSSGPLPLFFGGIFGVPTVNIQSTAIAVREIPAGPGLLVLDRRDDTGLSLTGNADITIDNGAAVVDASGSAALSAVGNAQITASNLNITGNYSINGNVTLPGQNGTSGQTSTGVAPTDDPLSYLTIPGNFGTTYSNGSYSGNSSPAFQPGYYPNGISLKGNANATFAPGVYVIDNGFSTAGNASISGTNVTFIMNAGSLSIKGNGAFNLTPPSSGIYQNIVFYQPSSNTSTASLVGNASMNIAGTLYFPSAELDFKGNANYAGNQIICYDMANVGNANFTINNGYRFGNAVMYLVQ